MSELTERLKTLLIDLTEQPGVSGNEQPVVRLLRDRLKPLCDDLLVDPFGNLIATRTGDPQGPKMMVAAHSDEIGAIITAVLPDGLLRFQLIGVVNPAILPATRVRVANEVIGTITSVPGHLANGSSILPVSSLHIDVGAKSEFQISSWGIRVGSPVVFESPLVVMKNSDLVMGKAIDNRIGCAVLVAMFEALAGKDLPLTLYGVVNVMEEIGIRGAHMTATRLMPDFAIALDTVPADNNPQASNPEMAFKLGCGPVIQLAEGKPEQFLGAVAHPGVRDLILETAKALDIGVQLSAAYGYWTTDGAAIHTSGTGIPTGYISIPRRYAHSPNEIIDLNDAAAATELIQNIASHSGALFNPNFLE